MNHKDLIDAVQKRAIQLRDGMHISKVDIEAVLTALADVATPVLTTEDGEIPLPGLGKLKAVTKAARTGRNPATGEEIQIPAKHTAKFVPAKALKDALA